MKTMSGNIENHGDSTFASISLAMMLLSIIGVSTIAAIIGICSGVVSLVINWPKMKARLQQIFKTKNQKQ